MKRTELDEISPLLRAALSAAMDVLVSEEGNAQYERDKSIAKDYIVGMKIAELSDKYDLTKERIRQILVHTAVSLNKRAVHYEALRLQVSELKRELELSEMRKKCLSDIVLRNKWKVDYKNIPQALYRELESKDFSTRAYRCIRLLGLTYVWQLASMTRLELMSAHSCGETTVRQFEQYLESLGLHLGMDIKGIYGLCDDKTGKEE